MLAATAAAERCRLVGVATRGKPGEKHHREPHDGERCGRNEPQVKPGDDQHVGKAGQREPLTQSLADTAAVADYQRTHLGSVSARCWPARLASIKAPIRPRIVAI